MAKVRLIKGNRVVKVEKEEVEKYLTNGYYKTDKDGKAIKTLKDVKELQAEIYALKEENTKLKEALKEGK